MVSTSRFCVTSRNVAKASPVTTVLGAQAEDAALGEQVSHGRAGGPHLDNGDPVERGLPQAASCTDDEEDGQNGAQHDRCPGVAQIEIVREVVSRTVPRAPAISMESQ